MWAAITKYHSLGGLNNRHWFCTFLLEARKSKIKVLADLVPGESPLTGLQMVTFSLYPHMVERARVLVSLPLPIRTLILSRGPTLMTSSKPNYLSKALPPHTIPLGVKVFKIYILGGHEHVWLHRSHSDYDWSCLLLPRRKIAHTYQERCHIFDQLFAFGAHMHIHKPDIHPLSAHVGGHSPKRIPQISSWWPSVG